MWLIPLFLLNFAAADTLEDIGSGTPGTSRAYSGDEASREERKEFERQEEEAIECEKKDRLDDRTKSECSNEQKPSEEAR
jgi:hypothetical protein